MVVARAGMGVGVGGFSLMGTEFPFCKTESSGGRWWSRLHNTRKVLNTTKLKHLKIVTMANLCCVYFTTIVF